MTTVICDKFFCIVDDQDYVIFYYRNFTQYELQSLDWFLFKLVSILGDAKERGVLRDKNLIEVSDEEFTHQDVSRIEIDRATF